MDDVWYVVLQQQQQQEQEQEQECLLHDAGASTRARVGEGHQYVNWWGFVFISYLLFPLVYIL